MNEDVLGGAREIRRRSGCSRSIMLVPFALIIGCVNIRLERDAIGVELSISQQLVEIAAWLKF